MQPTLLKTAISSNPNKSYHPLPRTQPPRKNQSSSVPSIMISSKLTIDRVSTPSSNSDTVTPASTVSESCSNFHKAHCPHTNCGKSYTGRDSRVNLRRHIRTFHEGGKMTKCPKCEHQSPRRDNIRKHFLSRHKGDELPSVLRCRTRA